MNTYTQKITQVQAKEIKELLEGMNASFDVVQYSLWRAKKPSFQAVYYTSGKLLVQGKEIDSVVKTIENVLGIESGNEKSSDVETGLPKIESDKYIGTDESGKGDFFGPLVCAGVQVNGNVREKLINAGIKDSKKLDDKKIAILADLIKANCVHSVVVIMPEKYNELYSQFKNLNKLLAWAHARAIENVLEKSPCDYALADKFGDESLIQNALMKKGQKITLKQAVRAEADIAVACASVLARAEFVKRMSDMSKKYELSFSKGVSDKVIGEAKLFAEKYSKQRLNEVAKMHFKTASVI